MAGGVHRRKERLDAARGAAMMPIMSEWNPIEMPETLGVIAGLGTYPWQLARSAHAQGVKRVVALKMIRAGDQDDSFYILTAGSAQVQQAQKILGQIDEGAVFGEVAFFDRQPRSATIRALSEGSVARFSRDAFESLAAWEPVLARRILYELGHALAIRLRAAERRGSGA